MDSINGHSHWHDASPDREALAIAVIKGACQTLLAAGFHPEEVMALFGQMASAPEHAGRTLRRSRRFQEARSRDWSDPGEVNIEPEHASGF